MLIEGLRTGSYTIEVKSDINKFKTEVKISEDNTIPISIKTGSIKLTSEVSGKVYLNGKYYQDVGSSGTVLFTRLLEGNYDIEVRTESKTFKKEVPVRIGETTAISVDKPKETVAKPIAQKTGSYSDDDTFYALGFYGSYNLGISPVYKESRGSTAEAVKPFLNQGFSVGLTWARFYVGTISDFQLVTGYTFYRHSFGNDESITHHEFDVFGFKIGLGSKHIRFNLIPIHLYCHWEEVQYDSIQGKEKTTGTACFGIAPGCALEFAIGNYFSIYAEYRCRITMSKHISFKHSCNIGININVLRERI